MAKSTPIDCFVCGGTYTADQRRRHEQTAKHQEALAPAVEANVAKENGRPLGTPSVPSNTPFPAPKFVYGESHPAEAAEIDRLMKVVKSREADVRWTTKHMDGKDPVKTLAKRKERLAQAQAELDAALMSIPETGMSIPETGN